MARISFSQTFLKEVIQIFRERNLKEIIFGKKVKLAEHEKNLLIWIKQNPEAFRAEGGRSGKFIKRDIIHRGRGNVYLLPNKLGASANESLVLFDDNVAITPGPDLYLYLSTNEEIKKDLGEFLDLGLIHGTKGGQIYVVKQPITELGKYKSAVIWCKQFAVLFTYAILN